MGHLLKLKSSKYLAKPGSTAGSCVVDELLEEGERQLALGRLLLGGGRVDVDVHDVLGQSHVALLVVLVLHDEDGVEPGHHQRIKLTGVDFMSQKLREKFHLVE